MFRNAGLSLLPHCNARPLISSTQLGRIQHFGKTVTKRWIANSAFAKTLPSESASNAPLYSELTTGQWLNRLPEFKFPDNSLYFALTPEHGRADFPKYQAALEEHGVLSIQLGFRDPLSRFVVDLTQAIGHPRTHSAKEGVLWCLLF